MVAKSVDENPSRPNTSTIVMILVVLVIVVVRVVQNVIIDVVMVVCGSVQKQTAM